MGDSAGDVVKHSSIRQKGDGDIIRKDGPLTRDFVELGVIRNKNTDNLTHVTGV